MSEGRECKNCGGTHFGSVVCPFLPEEIEKNKALADEGFWRKRREEMNGVEVWLWKNGDHYLGYTHLYPCDGNGDPLTLGEPVGKVFIKSSLPRELFTHGIGFNSAARTTEKGE